MAITRRTAIAGAGAFAIAGCATTQSTPPLSSSQTQPVRQAARQGAASANYFDATPAPFPQFAAIPENPTHRFGFASWNDLISRYVVDFGPSDRVARRRPAPEIGSRFTKGHDSPYRAEGNRIPFSVFEEEDVKRFVQGREVLEELGNQAPLSSFGWSDQLAFWLNLHNAALIEQLALRYPVPHPERMRVGPNDLPLHNAKLVTIHGTPLSLRDIRVEIVYRYWRHPGAIYGFFLGCVGGPSIRRGAYTGEGVNRQLASSANEFVNSLRGVEEYRSYIGVSRSYEEALPIFKDWQTELRTHLSEFAGDQVGELLQSDKPLRIKQYDTRIADLAGGETRIASVSRAPITALAPSANNPAQPDRITTLASQLVAGLDHRSASSSLPSGLPEHANRTLRERMEKFGNLNRRRRKRSGRVTIEDLPTEPVQ